MNKHNKILVRGTRPRRYESHKDLPKDIQEELFKRHTHAGLFAKFELNQEDVISDPDQIVYKEAEVLAIIEFIEDRTATELRGLPRYQPDNY